jgi:thiol-disulfide isomerase/thioredoxin
MHTRTFSKPNPPTNTRSVDFTATWCGPCKRIGPVFEAISLEPAYGTVVFVKVDVVSAPIPPGRVPFQRRRNAPFLTRHLRSHAPAPATPQDENEEASQQAGISCMPTFQLYKGGAKVETLEGASEAGLRSMLDKHK